VEEGIKKGNPGKEGSHKGAVQGTGLSLSKSKKPHGGGENR